MTTETKQIACYIASFETSRLSRSTGRRRKRDQVSPRPASDAIEMILGGIQTSRSASRSDASFALAAATN